jgi:hypothetical protein
MDEHFLGVIGSRKLHVAIYLAARLHFAAPQTSRMAITPSTMLCYLCNQFDAVYTL